MTARAGTEVEAANLALAHLRQPGIAALSDANARARAVNKWFGTARAAALRLRWWNFATGWETLAAASGVVRPGPLKSAFPLPADCVEVRFVQDATTDEWAVEAFKADPAGSDAEVSVLVANLTGPVICYTRDVETVRLWDADFLIAFSYQLAAFMAPELGLASRVGGMQAAANDWKEEAAAVDGREKAKSALRRETSWLSARRR